MTTTAELAPITKTVVVAATVERAFALFTAEMGRWWPLRTHSVGAASSAGVVMGDRVGGVIVETLADGSTAVWGTITDWAPPALVAFTWHPGQSAAEATRVEVTFAEQDAGTLVTLVHSGWEARPDAERARRGYTSGWDVVLASLAASSAPGAEA